ncbi:MAG: DNA repair protein RecN [Clostridiales bacterium]|nr:DNA repair protein RecN [Clostridiales bacterium]
MLSRLYIKNIALISEANINFDKKLNILSGETGSGKSVILDSLNFVLGSKADKNMIRYGESEAMVRAEFTVSTSSDAYKSLADLDIESDGEIIISRKLSKEGKGNIKINGNTVTASMLKSVTQHLVDVHGQSEHFVLLNEANQLAVIDNLSGKICEDLKENLSNLLKSKRELNDKIKLLGGDEQERERRLDLLNYQINEIDNADLKEGEFEELVNKRLKISNIEKILNALKAVDELFYADGGCADIIRSAGRYLSPITSLDKEYEALYDRLEGLRAEAEDISETVSDLADEIDFDEQEAEFVEDRIALIKRLKKKYGADESEILNFRNNAKNEYDALLDSANLVEKYQKQLKDIDGNIFEICKKLTDERKKCAEKLCKNVEIELKSLNIPNAKFTVDFTDYDFESANLKSANGSDEIQFMFSANKGEPLKPLNKVISGGEMSRFMLALKTQLKSLNGISTYVFDEIDAGISGYTAKTVAEKFVSISKNTQIIAVSHLAQVCAASDSQFLIYKTEEEGKTVTLVKKLNKDEKIDEIIRLSGNINNDFAKKLANELIEQFK